MLEKLGILVFRGKRYGYQSLFGSRDFEMRNQALRARYLRWLENDDDMRFRFCKLDVRITLSFNH